MSGDNFHFDITGAPLPDSLAIAFSEHPKGAVGWLNDNNPITGTPRLVLFWMDDPSMSRLPAPMNAEESEPFIRAWLRAVYYGKRPDHDGDNGKGWRVYNEDWGHVGHHRRAFVAIEPAWIMYGK